MPIADFKAHIKSACEASAAATAAELEGLLHGQQCQIADLEYEIGTLTRSLRETNEGCIEDFQKIKKLEAQLAQRKRRWAACGINISPARLRQVFINF